LPIVLFCLAIFILPAVGLVVLFMGKPVLVFWLLFVYLMAYPLVYAFFVPLLTGVGKLSHKKVFVLSLGVTMTAIVVTNAFWTIITPKWSFSVVTDKTTYVLGESVKITVTLKNLGFIAHSFKSGVSDPVIVSVEYQPTENPTILSQVWYSPFHKDITEFRIAPNQSFERNFIWNQTNVYFPEKEIKPGRYHMKALIPSVDSTIGYDNLFAAWLSINILLA